jgi:hypothetical protein
MQKYTEIQTLKLSKTQKETLLKLKSRGYNINQFIRIAISEKIKREYEELIEKSKKEFCPF